MTEKSHAELERHHYEALASPEYRLAGLVDVLLAEIAMNMPRKDMDEAENK